MSHTDETESDIFRVRPSILPYLALMLFSVVAGSIAAIFIYGLFPIITYGLLVVLVFVETVVFFSWFTTIYALTTERIEYRFGIIGTKQEFIETKRVSSVEVHRGLLGKILNFGDIIIEGDNPMSIFTFKYIGDPKQRLKQIEHQTIDKKD